MINNKHNFIFIHIPKTAGTSIESVFGKCRAKHKTIKKTLRDIPQGKTHEDYFKFTFIRNPWDRIVSLYEYLKREAIQADKAFLDFHEWVVTVVCKRHSERRNMNNERRHFATYCDWLEPSNIGDTFYIGRFENLQESFDIICDKIGHDQVKLPHKLKSKRVHYTDYYDKSIEELVYNKYRDDIDKFNYKYEDD